MANISARIDDQLKVSAERVADSIGIPLSTAINIFIKRFIAEGGFPFEVKAVYQPKHSAFVEAKKLESMVRQATADPDNSGIPQHFSYFDPITNQVVTHYRTE